MYSSSSSQQQQQGGGSAMPNRLTMPGQIHKSYKVMLKLLHPKFFKQDKSIPLTILKKAKGIAFITEIKAGFIWSGTMGSGIVIARLPDGSWSGPSSLGVVGVGWGGLIGASVTDSVIILNTDLAVSAFSGHGQIKFGGNLSVAAGPVGREADGSGYLGDGGIAACYSYSHSRGLFAGISLQGAVLVTRDSDNARFYGRTVKSRDILRGKVSPPGFPDLTKLFDLLNLVNSNDPNGAVAAQFADASLVRFDDNEGEEEARQASFRDSQQSSFGNYHLTSPSLNPPPPPVRNTLPPGWVKLSAGDKGDYYWHQGRNITQWEAPTREEVPMAQEVKKSFNPFDEM